jgi:hypothetical protein
MEYQLTEDLRELVSKILESDESEWWIRDLTGSYSWMRSGEIVWFIEPDTDRSVMTARLKYGVACLSCADGLPAISMIIADNLGDKPFDGLGTEKFAKLLAEWRSDPRCYILTPHFFETKQPELDDWLMGTETDANALKEACVEPSLKVENSGSWALRFNLINRFGGVEQWSAAGTSAGFDIDAIEVNMLRGNGSFYYPDEI